MKKEVQVYILKLLQLVRTKICKDNEMQISLMIGEDGRLWLWIPIDGKFQSIIFDENYEDKEPEAIVADIINDFK